MLPEWHEQLRSGDQGFLFRAMVTTDSAEVTGILSVSTSMKRNVCLSFYTLHFARHCSVLSTGGWRLNEQVAVPTCIAAFPIFIPSWRRADRLDV